MDDHPGFGYLPATDQLLLKLFVGDGSRELATEVTSTARTPAETTVSAHLTPTGRLLSVAIHDARRKIPTALWKQFDRGTYASVGWSWYGSTKFDWSQIPGSDDVLAIPLFDEALAVHRHIDVCGLVEGLAPIGLLQSSARNVLGILVFDASNRLADELLPPKR